MDLVSWIFFGPAKLVAAWPYAGIFIAAALIVVQVWISQRRGAFLERGFFREATVFAGLLWLIFNLYELQLAASFAQNQIAAPLRMDLIVLVPILYALSCAAIFSIRAQLRKIPK